MLVDTADYLASFQRQGEDMGGASPQGGFKNSLLFDTEDKRLFQTLSSVVLQSRKSPPPRAPPHLRPRNDNSVN